MQIIDDHLSALDTIFLFASSTSDFDGATSEETKNDGFLERNVVAQEER